MNKNAYSTINLSARHSARMGVFMQKTKRFKQILLSVCMVAALSFAYSQPVFAMTESEIQTQINIVGKETASGNVLIWFLCAIAFLKISQKIDSFMSSLGINVGHTGGSMLAEAMIAARGIGGLKNFSSHHFGGEHSTNAGSKGFMSGGLAGIVSSRITNEAVKSATASSKTNVSYSSGKAGGGIGSHIYASSVSKGGSFANNIIGTVAAGNLAELGFMSGPEASQALQSYLGYAALGENALQVPAFSDVEIGGGHITGTETSEEYPQGIAFGMYHAAQYAAPEGNYTTIQAADGSSWYKQYAQDVVDRSPYMAPDGSIAYKESIVKKLPQPPKRRERM